MKRRSIGLSLVALAIFSGLFYLYGGHQTPSETNDLHLSRTRQPDSPG